MVFYGVHRAFKCTSSSLKPKVGSRIFCGVCILQWKLQISFYKKRMPVSHAPNQSPFSLNNRKVRDNSIYLVNVCTGGIISTLEDVLFQDPWKEVDKRIRFPLQRTAHTSSSAPRK